MHQWEVEASFLDSTNTGLGINMLPGHQPVHYACCETLKWFLLQGEALKKWFPYCTLQHRFCPLQTLFIKIFNKCLGKCGRKLHFVARHFLWKYQKCLAKCGRKLHFVARPSAKVRKYYFELPYKMPWVNFDKFCPWTNPSVSSPNNEINLFIWSNMGIYAHCVAF